MSEQKGPQSQSEAGKVQAEWTSVQAYLLAESGRHFDPNVVAGFMSLDLAGIKLVEASD